MTSQSGTSRILACVAFLVAACGGRAQPNAAASRASTQTADAVPASGATGTAKDHDDGEVEDNTVVVSPENMHGWVFIDDNTNLAGTGSMVTGPATPPAGKGSARLHLTGGVDRQLLSTRRYAGTRMDGITALSYWTYRTSADAGNILAISLQFDIDYDLAQPSPTFQGRLVFEPYQTAGAESVPAKTWQRWDARSGKWWASRAPGNVFCPQSAPCTFAQVLSHFPNAGVKPVTGFLHLKAGAPWPGFDGNVDALTVGVRDEDPITWDFEPESSDSD